MDGKGNKQWLCLGCGHKEYEKFLVCGVCGAAGRNKIEVRDVYIEKNAKDRYEASECRVLKTFSAKFNEMLGGGLGLSKFVLMGGQTGAGKSSLWLKHSRDWSNEGTKVLYVATEEIWDQIKNKIAYLNISEGPMLKIMETKEGVHVIEQIKEYKPSVIIIDSLEDIKFPVEGSAMERGGTPAQKKYFSQEIDKYLKNENILGIVICQLTKKGKLSVPENVEHRADIIMKLYGDNTSEFRKIEVTKFKDQFNLKKMMNYELVKNKGLMEVTPQVKIGHNNEPLKEKAFDCAYGAFMGDIEYLCVRLEKITVKRMGETTKVIGELIKSAALAKIDLLKQQGVDTAGLIIQMPEEEERISPVMDLAMVGAAYNYCKEYMLSDRVVMLGEVDLDGCITNIKSDDMLKMIDMKKVLPNGRIMANCNEPSLMGLPVTKVMSVRDLTIALDSIATNEGLVNIKSSYEEQETAEPAPAATAPEEQKPVAPEEKGGAIVMGGENERQLDEMARIQEVHNETIKILNEDLRKKIARIQKNKKES